MTVTRRHLAAAGALALGASTLLRNSSALAQSGDQKTVTDAVDALRLAMLKQDKAKLETLVADQVSYGHSGARVEDKGKFIEGVMTRKATVKTLEFPELSVAVVGNNAIARHLWHSESELDGKATTTKIGVLQVWQKQDGNWKLLARQGFTLPA